MEAASLQASSSPSSSHYDSNNPFREVEKVYKLQAVQESNIAQSRKRRKIRYHSTDYSNAIDLHNIDANTTENRGRIVEVARPAECKVLGAQATIYGIRDVPGIVWRGDLRFRADICLCAGFYVIARALSVHEQLRWATLCVASYSNTAHTNL